MLEGRAAEPAVVGSGYLVAASLGLLSLLIAFTLAMSLERYETRRELVVDEASDISTAWLRDQMLAEPFRTRLESLLQAYVKERRADVQVQTTPTELDAADRRAAAMEQRIWQETVAGLQAPHGAELAVPVLSATNQMLDRPPAERAALDAQVPEPVMWTLLAVGVISAILTGYGLAAGGQHHWIASAGFFVAVALTITLIFELDEPRTGLIRVPEAPLDRAAEEMGVPPAVSR